MRTGAVLLLNIGLVIVGLFIYDVALAPAGEVRPSAVDEAHTMEPDQSHKDAAAASVRVARARLGHLDRRLAGAETSLLLLRRAVADLTRSRGVARDHPDALEPQTLAIVQQQIEEIERRKIAEQRTKNLHIGVKELQLGLTEEERHKVVEIIQASHGKVGAYAQELRETGTPPTQETMMRYDEILIVYRKKVRALLPEEKAEKVIARFMPLR